MDTLSRQQRSERMSLIRGKDTKPEILVRKLIYSMGYRYRLHRKDLPGSPDIVLSSLQKAIFVHGCFWHRHPRCRNNRLPKSRLKFWKTKLDGNRKRDLANLRRLKRRGWSYLVVWECQIADLHHLRERIASFLEK